ncbi:hypothetical protein [Nocardioides jejuensis]|uniref:Uncharacterized protein n=1 Tax=Nocardioides jejuensis TaxID=2502782 RepID=A0A4R1CIQ1_9ACTN|nr:hypothetical protein [Nocardioides jejuensis]TCJ30026.1 hypothetical protein EPD65_05425 [Nocardioides jejuensis]
MAEADPAIAAGGSITRWWLVATVALTLSAICAGVLLAPPESSRVGPALTSLLFLGASVHVGSTAWFYGVPAVRCHMWRNPKRYLVVPAVLVVATVAAVLLVPRSWVPVGLLAFFAWQFFHFQKQNLGVAAIAARATGSPSLVPSERRAIVLAGCGGTAALVGRPELLRIAEAPEVPGLFAVGVAVFAAAAGYGVVAVLSRTPTGRSPAFLVVYLTSLLFFAPVFLFDSPYAAVAGITIAHGLQYLLLMGLLAAAPNETGARSVVGVLVLVNVAVVVGLGLSQASHFHEAHGWTRAFYGIYLGLVMSHFVIDAGLWRLRDEFPRAFLTQRLPGLLARRSTPALAE